MRIGFTGAQGTGKTTLADMLQDALPGHKRYLNVQRLFKQHLPSFDYSSETNDYTQLVITSHQASELITTKDLIADRSMFDCMGYSYTAKHITLEQAGRIRIMFEPMIDLYDLIIYVPIEYAMSDSDGGMRETDENYRRQVDNQIKYWLNIYKPRYITVTGSVEQRYNQIKKELKIK